MSIDDRTRLVHVIGGAPLELVPAEPLELAPDRDPLLVYLARLAPGSRPTMRGSLESIARELGASSAKRVAWHLLRYQHTSAIRARLVARGLAHGTVNKMLTALRGVLLACTRLGYMSREDHANAVDVESVHGTRVLSGRALSAAELRALFTSCADGTKLGARDAALLGLAYGCGLRRAEIAELTLEQLEDEGTALRVLGKGNRERRVWLPRGARLALERWLELRGREPGALFWAMRKSGGWLEPLRRMTREGVAYAVKARGRAAGVRGFSPHDLRRSVMGDMLDAGVDLVAVAGIMGHAQITTTARYDRRGERARRGASDLVLVPFVEEDA